MADSAAETCEVTSVTFDDRRMRFLYMVIFAILAWAALWLIVFLATAQFLLSWITGSVNGNLRNFSGKLGIYFRDMLGFLGYVTDIVPFPFSPIGAGVGETEAAAPKRKLARRRKPATANANNKTD
ncbi:MAG: DUF4389 domain-containing protein [Alphaproteobacteria bacterium]|jgi:hypothetical protein|nr:DUF4389 domain-containing protein [Alphaproteobacteria bacterium]HJM61309.1 DUF4389 domain-containing protein [Alphaproteobacteria bacterium]